MDETERGGVATDDVIAVTVVPLWLDQLISLGVGCAFLVGSAVVLAATCRPTMGATRSARLELHERQAEVAEVAAAETAAAEERP